MNKEQIEKVTKEILNEIGIKINLKGYRYWTEAVVQTIHKNQDEYKLVRGLYEDLAKHFNSTASRIERALRHAFISNGKANEYFSVDYKITNSAFLMLLQEKVKERLNEHGQYNV